MNEMTRSQILRRDSELQAEETRKVFTTAIASVRAFAKAIEGLPYPPWNTIHRARPAARQ